MGVMIKLLEPANVYDINNIKANPIAELNAGTEVEVESVFKAWKVWYKVKLPDGRVGLIPTLTKAQSLGYLAPKAGGWSNFVKVLASGNPEQYGYDMDECIKEYEQEIINHIQSNKDVDVILGCARVKADWLLQEEVINQDVVDHLAKKALKSDLSPIQALIKIEQIQKKNLVSDEVIKLLITKAKASDSLMWSPYISFLIDVALLRQSSTLVDEILDIYRNSKYQYFAYGGFRALHLITNDNRIIDFLVDQLKLGFRLIDKYTQTQSLSDLFIYKNTWGPAYYAAEELLAIGDLRGISAIVPHVLAFVAGEHIRNIKGSFIPGGSGGHLGNPELREWVVEHSQLFHSDLVDGLYYNSPEARGSAEARCFAINCIINIGYPEGIEDVKKLSSDPDKHVRGYVEDVLAYKKIK